MNSVVRFVSPFLAVIAVSSFFAPSVQAQSSAAATTLGPCQGASFPGVVVAAPTPGDSIARADFDGDGDLDLAIPTRYDGVKVAMNKGNGTFTTPVTYAAGTISVNASSGDVNGDGKPDLLVANRSAGTISVLLNHGNGTFAADVEYPAGAQPGCIAIGDVDGDLDRDLAVTNFSASTVTVLRNLGAGTFGAPQPYGVASGPKSVVLADMDGDTDLDLVVSNSLSHSVSIRWNAGTGTFNAHAVHATGTTPFGLAVGDVDGDTDRDIAVATHDGIGVSVLENLGNSAFAPVQQFAAGPRAAQVALTDLDGDLDLDLAVANDSFSNGTVSVLRNPGNGSFEPQVRYGTPGDSISIASGDFDGDGDADLAVGHGDNGQGVGCSLLLNRGDATFAAQRRYPTALGPRVVALGDLDGDFDLDVVTANYEYVSQSNGVSVLINAGDGTLAPQVQYLTSGRARSVAIGDVDGDTDQDLVVVDASGSLAEHAVHVFLNQGNGTFAPFVAYPNGPQSSDVVLGDLDGDGDLDVAVANTLAAGSTVNTGVSVLLNNGNGTFAAPTFYDASIPKYALAIGDFDGDLDLDLAATSRVFASGSQPTGVVVLINQGNATFTPQTLGAYGPQVMSIEAADLDGDHDVDLVAADQNPSTNGAFILRNLGGGTFDAQNPIQLLPGVSAWDVAVADIDGDGDVDLALAGVDGAVAVRLNNGLSFAPREAYAAGGTPGSVVIGDLNGDQRPDLVVADVSGQEVSVLLQECTQTCELAGTAYCFGDGSLATPCPCVPPDTVPNPSGATGSGCANAFNFSGASLVGCGSKNPDRVVLRAQGLSPAGLTVFVKGSASAPSGLASGDGVLCASGALVRFGSQVAVEGRAHYPNTQLGQTIPISTFGATPPGSGLTGHYQALYRNLSAGFCNPGTYNFTSAFQITWN